MFFIRRILARGSEPRQFAEFRRGHDYCGLRIVLQVAGD
jgi:hypothetical protein